MADAIIFGGFCLSEAVLGEDELNQRDVLFIKFHMRDITGDQIPHNDTGEGHGDDDDRVDGDDDAADDDDDGTRPPNQVFEFFSRSEPPQIIESLSIPREQTSNRTELLHKISDVLTRLNVSPPEYAEKIYSRAALSLESSELGETIRPILVDITFVTFEELTRRLGNLSVSTMHTCKSSVEELEKIDGSKLEENCPICLLEFSTDESKVVRTPCSHVFHEECLVKWLEKSHSCPICRFELPVNSCPNCSKIVNID